MSQQQVSTTVNQLSTVHQVQSTVHQVQSTVHQVQSTVHQVQSTVHQVQSTENHTEDQVHRRESQRTPPSQEYAHYLSKRRHALDQYREKSKERQKFRKLFEDAIYNDTTTYQLNF
jgi:ribosomal protein L19E